MTPRSLFAVTLAAASFSPQALAGDKTADDFKVSVTLAPFLLILSTVELTGELKVADRASVAAIGGLGSYRDYSFMDLGAQGRYYLLGDFRSGMPVGAELLFARLDYKDSYSASGTSLSTGAFVGGKWTADAGFTLDGSLGVQYVTAVATADRSGATTEEDGFGPLLNLNLGWSF